MVRRYIGFDTETYLITPGNMAPRLVVASFSSDDPFGPGYILKLRDAALDHFEILIQDPSVVLVGHNIAFDLAVMAKHRSHLMPLIFKALDEGRVRDSMIVSLLNAIRHTASKGSNWLNFDPVLGGHPRFNLAAMTKRYLGIDVEGKGPDEWRTKYSLLDDVPLTQWPQKAKSYAGLDSVYPVGIVNHIDSKYGPLPDEVAQTQAAFAFHLLRVAGMRVDRDRLQDLSDHLTPLVEASLPKLLATGIVRWEDPTRDMSRVTELVLQVYPDAPLTKAGKVSTSRKVLEKAGEHCPVLSHYLDMLELGTAKYDPLLHKEGIYRPGKYVKNTGVISQRCAAFYRREGLERPLTDTGKDLKLEGNPKWHDVKYTSTAGDVLAVTDDPDLLLLYYISEAEKELNTFVNPLLALPQVHPWWNCLVSTGRSSCRGPNLQQLPRRNGVRECFVPRDGYTYVAADYHVAELHSLAEVCVELFGWSKMADALNEGKDLHLVTAGSILGISDYDELHTRYKAGDSEVKNARQLAKAMNFGLPGGLGAKTFKIFAYKSAGVKISLERSKELKRIWLTAYPEISAYFKWVNSQLELYGDTWGLVQAKSGRVRRGVTYPSACNSMFQGLTADGAKHALYLVAKECWSVPSSPLYGSFPVAFIHDEIILESPLKVAHLAAARLEELMVLGMKAYVSHVPTRADAHLMDVWSKDAEAVYDDDKKLIPWRPDGPCLHVDKEDKRRDFLLALDLDQHKLHSAKYLEDCLALIS